MPQSNIVVSGSSEMDLLTRENIIKEMLEESTEVLKRLSQLKKIPKAKGYLETEMKFTMLKILLK